MNRKKYVRRLMAAAVVILGAAVMGIAAYAHAQPADAGPGLHGRLSASVETDGRLSPGETFDVNIRIDDNTGFAGMTLRLGFPSWLEVVSIQSPFGTATHSFEAHWPVPSAEAGVAYAFAGWAGRTANIYDDRGLLLTYTLRLSDGAAGMLSGRLTLAFANPAGHEEPSDADARMLDISLPGGLPADAVAELGTVSFGVPTAYFNISIGGITADAQGSFSQITVSCGEDTPTTWVSGYLVVFLSGPGAATPVQSQPQRFEGTGTASVTFRFPADFEFEPGDQVTINALAFNAGTDGVDLAAPSLESIINLLGYGNRVF